MPAMKNQERPFFFFRHLKDDPSLPGIPDREGHAD
jgi:hypothetical protein